MSDKHQELTESQMAGYKPNPVLMDAIMEFCTENGLAHEETRILDWGCGRGRFVLFMRRKGFQCYGVDKDAAPVEKAAALYEKNGIDKCEVLRTLNSSEKSDFPDEMFDIVVSDQVLEHVRNLDDMAQEMARLTKKGGMGVHCFPARFGVIESHLYMPFVHWMSPTKARKRIIKMYVMMGIEPKWPIIEHVHNSDERVRIYSEYLNEKTFYRSGKVIENTFSKQGFTARFIAERIPRISEIRPRVIRRLLGWWATHFKMCYLALRRV